MSLPQLPYHKADLAPYISQETMDYHYGKHHLAYITKLKTLISGTLNQKLSLTQLILKTQGPTFNNAAQHWNHSFYWYGMSPKKNQPSGQLLKLIQQKWVFNQKVQGIIQQQCFEQLWLWMDLVGEERKQ